MSDQWQERFPHAPKTCPVCGAPLRVEGEQTLFVPCSDDDADFNAVILVCTATPNKAAHTVLLSDHVNFEAWPDGTEDEFDHDGDTKTEPKTHEPRTT